MKVDSLFLKAVIAALVLFSNNGKCMEKYKWQSSESAPKNYPMEIVAGSLLRDNHSVGFVPGRSIIDLGWGLDISSYVVGDSVKPLPDELKITFFSFTENKFYKGDFKLPVEKMESLFNKGYYSQNLDEETTYDIIVTGVAPGGTVSVWLFGPNMRTQVFFGEAHETEVNWKVILDNPKYTREEHIQLILEDELTTETLEKLKKNGVPLQKWKHYQKRYNWQPKITGMELRDGLINSINYYNGEKDFIYYPVVDNSNVKRAVPKDIRFIWKVTKNVNENYEVFFDEKEIFDVFEKLGSNNEPLELEMKVYFEGKQGKFAVSLKNSHETIYLKKFRLETYGAD